LKNGGYDKNPDPGFDSGAKTGELYLGYNFNGGDFIMCYK